MEKLQNPSQIFPVIGGKDMLEIGHPIGQQLIHLPQITIGITK